MVMENMFFEVSILYVIVLIFMLPLTSLSLQQNITRIFDLKGSSRARYVETDEASSESFDSVCYLH